MNESKCLDDRQLDVDGMINQYRKAVFKLAHTLDQSSPAHIEKNDLIQEGLEALCLAYERFDDERGVRFLTYAYPFVKNYMRDYSNGFTPISVPKNVVRIARVIRARGLENLPIDELVERCKDSKSVVRSALKYMELSTFSYHQENDENGEGYGELVGLFGSSDDLTFLDVDRFANTLPKKQQVILYRLAEGFTQQEVAREVGLSQTYVSRLRKRIRDKYLSQEKKNA